MSGLLNRLIRRAGGCAGGLVVMVNSLQAATYWVATDGSDSNNGTSSNTPFATPYAAGRIASLTAGDTVYVRGGTYPLNMQVKLGKAASNAGMPGNPIKFWAYPGELPIFDFATITNVTKALDVRQNYWHVKGIEVKNGSDTGIFVAGTGNIIEGCVIHHCNNDGLTLGSTTLRATNSLILNCDSYQNYQANSNGDNGDGFSAKAGNGPGNVFRGCRAWHNSDDAWDFYDNDIPVTLDNCWGFWNGYNIFGYVGTWNGNGNGFKLGGEGTAAEHRLTNCIAFGNRSKGFDHNNGNAGQTMVNCTSYSNNAANFSFYETPTEGTLLRSIFINNVSFGGTLTNLAANSLMISNSWQIASVTAADFASLDTTVATNARNADFTLPTNNLFRIAAGSDLIDRGLNVGLPFNGSAPDLGAFEFVAASMPRLIQLSPGGWTNGSFRLDVSGLTAHGPVVIHASTNFTAWTPIHTNSAATGTISYTDTAAVSLPRRFYRAEEQ